MSGMNLLTVAVERWKLAGNGNTYIIPAYPGFRGSGGRGSSLAVVPEETEGFTFSQYHSTGEWLLAIHLLRGLPW